MTQADPAARKVVLVAKASPDGPAIYGNAD
jgi:hypothetical protein